MDDTTAMQFYQYLTEAHAEAMADKTRHVSDVTIARVAAYEEVLSVFTSLLGNGEESEQSGYGFGEDERHDVA